MPYKQFDRFAVKMDPLSARTNKKFIETDHIPHDAMTQPLSETATQLIEELAGRVRDARHDDRPVMITFGAHAIKNGLGPVLLRLIETDWVTHLATNGAGVIHDWEFAYQGRSCEHVGPMVDEGRFGNWEETGYYVNLALNVGAYEGLGYGESVGAMIQNEGLTIPTAEQLEDSIRGQLSTDPRRAAAAADLLAVTQKFELPSGWMSIPHGWKQYSVQAGAYQNTLDYPVNLGEGSSCAHGLIRMVMV